MTKAVGQRNLDLASSCEALCTERGLRQRFGKLRRPALGGFVMGEYGNRVIRDPIYGYVSIPRSLFPIVDHPMVQRLRRISQTALASSVYPSMIGSRFEHSLGTMHLAGVAWKAVIKNSPHALKFFENSLHEDPDAPNLQSPLLETKLGEALACAALLHDVGHPPFSHALEPLYKEFLDKDDRLSIVPGFEVMRNTYRGGTFHEVVGHVLVEEILQGAEGLDLTLKQLARRLNMAMNDPGECWTRVLYGLIDGEIDVDRLDYLMRDTQRAGTEFGAIDYKRLLNSLQLYQPGNTPSCGVLTPTIFPGWRGRSAVETLLIQRLQAYRWVFFHPWVVASDLFLLRGLQMLMHLEGFSKLVAARTELEMVFTGIQANLDYVSPRTPTDAELLGAFVAGSLPPSPEGLQLLTGDWVTPIDLESRSSVDDSSILEWLKRGVMLSRIELSRNGFKGTESESYARRLVSYYSACINRQKTFFIGWGTYEDYIEIAKKMSSSLRNGIYEFWKGFEPTLSEPEKQWLSEPQTEAKEAIGEVDDEGAPCGELSGGQAVQLLNHVAKYAVGPNAFEFSAALNSLGPPTPGMNGFWEAIFRDFVAVKEKKTKVLAADGTLHVLQDSSPIVNSLVEAEDKRIKLFTFFVVVPESKLSGKTGKDGTVAMQTLFEGPKFRDLLLEKYKEMQRRHVEGLGDAESGPTLAQ